MGNESILAQIADNPKLPTPPTLTLRILDQASRPDCTIHQLGTLISYDPGLCGKMLKLVNSTLFGLQRPVTSVERALNLLGLNHVRSLVLSLTLPSLRFRHASAERMKAFWKASVTMAIVCREVASRKKWPDADSEMVAGLLCDLGELLLQETFPERYALVAKVAPEILVNNQCTVEIEQLGVDHAEAAAHFLKRWNLADELTDAIRFHHRPEAASAGTAPRAYLLYFASRIAQMHWKLDRSILIGEIVALAHERFGLDHEQLLTFLESLNQRIDEFAALIEVDLGSCDSFSELFVKATENLTKFAIAASLDNVRVLEEKAQMEQGLQLARDALHKSEEQLRQAQKMEAIGRLAGGVAHDFNNLLTVMLGNCDLLLELPSVDDEARGLIDLIRQTGERAAELTRQLLAFSRKQRLVLEVTHLNSIVANITRMLRRLLGDDVQLVTRLADDLDLVRIDPSQFSQVLMNLAVNARDAMPKGGCLTIETFNLVVGTEVIGTNSAIQPGRYVVMAVRDNGCGMDETTLQQIFEPFFTTKDGGKGTGLGLATVHGIIRQSGGHISVASEVAKGTLFHIYLPVAQGQADPPTKPNLPVQSLGGSETILLTEDMDDVRNYLRRSLEMYGYHVFEARNGVEALATSKRFGGTIHLLVTDMNMPKMSGRDLAEQMMELRPEIKVLFVSGHSEIGNPAPGEAFATTPFLQKPFTPSLLASKIRVVLATQPANRLVSSRSVKHE